MDELVCNLFLSLNIAFHMMNDYIMLETKAFWLEEAPVSWFELYLANWCTIDEIKYEGEESNHTY